MTLDRGKKKAQGAEAKVDEKAIWETGVGDENSPGENPGQPPVDVDKLRVVWCDKFEVRYIEYRKEAPIGKGTQVGVIWECWRCGLQRKELDEELRHELVTEGNKVACRCQRCQALYALQHRLIESPGEALESIARSMNAGKLALRS